MRGPERCEVLNLTTYKYMIWKKKLRLFLDHVQN